MNPPTDRVADPAVRFELCRDCDVPALMRFIGTHWRAEHVLSRDEPLLRWQFAPELVRGRQLPGPTVMLAWLGREIVGMLGLTAFDLNVAGERYPAAWMSHWFATPAYRGHNVAVGLMRAARELGVDALATLGANQASTSLLTQLGFEVLSSLPRWVGVFDVDAAAELACLANPDLSLENARRLCRDHRVDRWRAAPSEREFRPVSWNPGTAMAWDRFWREKLAAELVGATRDAAYLQWRYAAHPRFEYFIRFAQRDSDGSVEGVAVFRIEQVRQRTTRALRIVEFLTSAAAAGVLVRAVGEAAWDAGAAMGDFYCSSARVAEPFERAGFRREILDSRQATFPSRLQPLESERSPTTTLLRLPGPLRGRLPELVADGRLYITKSDGDQDRPN